MITGPSEREVTARGSRYALGLRSAIVLVCSAISIGCADLRMSELWLAVVILSWSAVQLGWVARRQLPLWFAPVDVLAVLAVCAGQLWYGPQAFGSWVFALVSVLVVTCHYEYHDRPGVGWFLGVTGVVAFPVGNAVSGSSAGLPGLVAQLITQLVLAAVALWLIRRAARSADRSAQRTAAQQTMAAVGAARRSADREYRAVLHDTAATTLLMVASGAVGHDQSWLPERAGQDLIRLAQVPRPANGDLDLTMLLTSVADTCAIALDRQLDPALILAADPALAILAGVQEALTNVERHSRSRSATLGGRQDKQGRLVVELTDHGCGFLPSEVPPHRRGIAESIVDRMARAGGSATVVSNLGSGTTVRWVYPRA